MKREYRVSDEQKKQFASAYLLDVIINSGVEIPLYLDKNDSDLEPVLEYMMMKQYLSVETKKQYLPTDKGKEVLRRFMQRYTEFLKIFDIYSTIDLAEGSFAFEEYFNFSSESEWTSYIQDEKWEDLRVAVAVYKKINPVEIVFMSFLKENQFGNRGEGWQFDLLLGSIWDEILTVCNTAISVDDLTYKDENDHIIDGKMVLEDIIEQGAKINLTLHKRELELMQQNKEPEQKDIDNENNGDVEDIDTRVYYNYCQPMYISPLWAMVLFL